MPIVVFGARTVSWVALLVSLAFVVMWSTGCAVAPTTLTDGTGDVSRTASAETARGASTDGGSASSGDAASSAASADAGSATACANPAEGCPCAAEGAQIACAGPKIHTGNYTSCADGVRSCAGGQWGACITPTAIVGADQVSQDDASPCPEGTVVQWGSLALDGLTPGNSQIAVSAQTAATQAGLDAATPVSLGTFGGSTETSWASADAQAAFAAAGLTSSAWVRVTLTLTSATSGGGTPTIAEWREASTCVAAR